MLMWGGISKDRFIVNFLESVTVKELWKSASIWCSYVNTVAYFLGPFCIYLRNSLQTSSTVTRNRFWPPFPVCKMILTKSYTHQLLHTFPTAYYASHALNRIKIRSWSSVDFLDNILSFLLAGDKTNSFIISLKLFDIDVWNVSDTRRRQNMFADLVHMSDRWKTSCRSHTCVNSSLEYIRRHSHMSLRCTAALYLQFTHSVVVAFRFVVVRNTEFALAERGSRDQQQKHILLHCRRKPRTNEHELNITSSN